MCEPTTVALMMAAAYATKSVVDTVAQRRAYDDQEAAIREQLAALEDEINETESAEVNDRLRTARKEQARIKVAAGEAGLQLGGSVSLLLTDSLMQAELSNDRTDENAERQLHAGRREANSMLSRVSAPTVLGGIVNAGMEAAKGGLQGYAMAGGFKVPAASAKSAQISRVNGYTGGKGAF